MPNSYFEKSKEINSWKDKSKIKLIDNGDDTFSIATVSGTSGRSAQVEGKRESIATGTHDIWEGSASTIPLPNPNGQQMAIVSDDNGDITGGAGAREVVVEYIDLNGDAQTEFIVMNGASEVLTVATDIIMINDFYVSKNGDGVNNNKGVALGNITIYEIGNSNLVYNIIKEGGNKSLSTLRMIPNNTVYQIDALIVSGDTKGVTVKFRVNESDTGVQTDGFLFRIPVTIGDSPASISLPTSIRVSSGRLIKATAFVPSGASGGNVSYLISGRLDTLTT